MLQLQGWASCIKFGGLGVMDAIIQCVTVNLSAILSTYER